MEMKYVALIIILSLFVFLLIIFAILSWKYQQKHQPYMEFRKDYFQNYQQLKTKYKTNLNLVELKTDLKLPQNEQLYLTKNKVRYYYQEVKKPKHKNSRAWLEKEYEEDYEILEAKANYSLNNRVVRYYKTNLNADLLVTNRRILLKDYQKIQEINFQYVISINPTIISLKKDLWVGFIIKTENEAFRFIDDEVNDVLILQTLLKNFLQEENHD